MNKGFLTNVIKFITVGVISTAINYFVFFLFYECLLINYMISSAFGYVVGLIIGFFLNHFWTFESTQIERNKAFGYLIVYAFSLGLSSLVLWITVSAFGIKALVANFLAICISTASNFVGLKFIIYRIDESKSN